MEGYFLQHVREKLQELLLLFTSKNTEKIARRPLRFRVLVSWCLGVISGGAWAS
jgi:hypothetical protein